jgi:hypothetical protein
MRCFATNNPGVHHLTFNTVAEPASNASRVEGSTLSDFLTPPEQKPYSVILRVPRGESRSCAKVALIESMNPQWGNDSLKKTVGSLN